MILDADIQEAYEELIGNKFGMLLVVSAAEPIKWNSVNKPLKAWSCKCDCGSEVVVTERNLVRGIATSCGCKKKKHWSDVGKSRKTHGLSNTKESSAWSHMIGRCYNKNSPQYKNYGGRGICVCDKWKNSFSEFVADVGMAPTKDHSLERINVNVGYEPGNVRWATWKEQQRNRRNNRLVTIGEETKTLAEWCEIYDASYPVVWQRICRLGIDPLLALTTKKFPAGKKANGT